MFQTANRGKGQARLDYILTKWADCLLVRLVNVQSPPLNSAEWDHNFVYYEIVQIPRRSVHTQHTKEGNHQDTVICLRYQGFGAGYMGDDQPLLLRLLAL